MSGCCYNNCLQSQQPEYGKCLNPCSSGARPCCGGCSSGCGSGGCGSCGCQSTCSGTTIVVSNLTRQNYISPSFFALRRGIYYH